MTFQQSECFMLPASSSCQLWRERERVQQKWEPVLRPNALHFLKWRAFRAANRYPQIGRAHV